MNVCSRCGTELKKEDLINGCPKCGTKVFKFINILPSPRKKRRKKEFRESKTSIKNEARVRDNVVRMNKNRVRLNENEVRVRDNLVKMNKKRVRLNENELIMNENELRLDENELRLDENELRLDENELIMNENRVRLDENELTMNENDIECVKVRKNGIYEFNLHHILDGETEVYSDGKGNYAIDIPRLLKKQRNDKKEDYI